MRIRSAQRTALALLVTSGISIAGMGVLLSAFLWAYALSQLPAGALLDRFGARRMLSAGLAVWSVAQVLGGLVGGFATFVAARVLLGIGEAPQSPASARIVRDWFPVDRRGAAPRGGESAAPRPGSGIARRHWGRRSRRRC